MINRKSKFIYCIISKYATSDIKLGLVYRSREGGTLCTYSTLKEVQDAISDLDKTITCEDLELKQRHSKISDFFIPALIDRDIFKYPITNIVKMYIDELETHAEHCFHTILTNRNLKIPPDKLEFDTGMDEDIGLIVPKIYKVMASISYNANTESELDILRAPICLIIDIDTIKEYYSINEIEISNDYNDIYLLVNMNNLDGSKKLKWHIIETTKNSNNIEKFLEYKKKENNTMKFMIKEAYGQITDKFIIRDKDSSDMLLGDNAPENKSLKPYVFESKKVANDFIDSNHINRDIIVIEPTHIAFFNEGVYLIGESK